MAEFFRPWKVAFGFCLLGVPWLARVAGGEVRPLALLSRGRPAFASHQNQDASRANDADYATAWRSRTSPSETSPVWLAYDLSGIDRERRRTILAVYTNDSASYYPPWPSYRPAGNPTDYAIEAHAATGGPVPDGGWVELLAVADNHYHSRQHLVDFGGYNWIRLRITGSEGDAGNGTDDAAVQLEVFDAGAGIEDDWIFFGDSITSLGMATGCRDSFAQLVHDASSGHTPAVENGGVPAATSADGAARIPEWVGMFPGKYVCIAFGTNDCDSPPERFFSNYVVMVDCVQAAGKIAVVPTVLWPKTAARQAAVVRLNEKIEELYRARPSVVPGPDLWTFFSTRPELIDDHIHPGAAGNAAMRRLWAGTMLTAVYSSGSGPSPTASPTCTPFFSPTPSSSPTPAAAFTPRFTAGAHGTTPRAFPNPWCMARHARPVLFGPLQGKNTIQIANVAGEIIAIIHSDEVFADWDPSRPRVAAGIYVYVIADETGGCWKGKLAVLR